MIKPVKKIVYEVWCDECKKKITDNSYSCSVGKPERHFHSQKWDYKKDKPIEKTCLDKWNEREYNKKKALTKK